MPGLAYTSYGYCAHKERNNTTDNGSENNANVTLEEPIHSITFCIEGRSPSTQ